VSGSRDVTSRGWAVVSRVNFMTSYCNLIYRSGRMSVILALIGSFLSIRNVVYLGILQAQLRDGLPAHRRSPIQVLTRQCTAGS